MTDNTGDARFEDGAEKPLKLKALDLDDLAVVSTLVQDAVVPAAQMRFDRDRRRFALLVNRFRWEDKEGADARKRSVERVQAVLFIDDVLAVRTQGVNPADKDMILSLLNIEFAPTTDGMGTITLTFAGDGALALDVEALEVGLQDVTRPYVAVSGKTPDHTLDLD